MRFHAFYMKRGYITRKPRKKGFRSKKTDLRKAKDKLWELCRLIIKKRYGNTCYTCSAKGLQGSNYQIGHFIPSSICSTELRYSLDNLRPQCAACNIWKSGNWPAYENHLLQEKGKNFVKELKARNEKTKGQPYHLDWILGRIKEYERLYFT